MTLIVNETKYRIDFTFGLTVTLMILLCKQETVIISLLSSLLHEIGHLWFMNIFNQRVEMVSFGAFGVRIDRQMTSAISYKKEAVIALGGIGVNFLIAIVGLLFYYVFSSAFSMKLSAVNIIIALFNMIPLDILDMGRVLRYTLLCSIEEHRCDIILTAISFVTVNLLALVSIAVTLFIGFNPSLVAVTLYLYVITLFKKWS
jgi:stage IV sporulation protein FB